MVVSEPVAAAKLTPCAASLYHALVPAQPGPPLRRHRRRRAGILPRGGRADPGHRQRTAHDSLSGTRPHLLVRRGQAHQGSRQSVRPRPTTRSTCCSGPSPSRTATPTRRRRRALLRPQDDRLALEPEPVGPVEPAARGQRARLSPRLHRHPGSEGPSDGAGRRRGPVPAVRGRAAGLPAVQRLGSGRPEEVPGGGGLLLGEAGRGMRSSRRASRNWPGNWGRNSKSWRRATRC